MLKINYQKIITQFNLDLINKLRQHGSEKSYLRLWVPNENFSKSFDSLVESVKSSKFNKMEIKVNKKYLSTSEKNSILSDYKLLKILENDTEYIFHLGDLNKIDKKKNVIDRLTTESSLNNKSFIYQNGSWPKKNIKKINDFLKFSYNKYSSDFENAFANFSISSEIKIKKKKISISKKKIMLIFSEEEEFIHLHIQDDDPLFKGVSIIFTRLFKGENLHLVGVNGSARLIQYLRSRLNLETSGILLLSNMGQHIFLLNNIFQFLLVNFRVPFQKKINYVPNDWLKMSDKRKIRFLSTNLIFFLKKQSLKINTMSVDKIENDLNHQPIKIYVSFNNFLTSQKKSLLITKLEKFYKEIISSLMQVYIQEKSDLNKIRRL